MLSGLCSKQVERKAGSILSDVAHSLFSEFQPLLLGSSFRFPLVRRNRDKYSIPAAITALNAELAGPQLLIAVATATTQEL